MSDLVQKVGGIKLLRYGKETHTRTLKVEGRECLFEIREPFKQLRAVDYSIEIEKKVSERIKKWDLQNADEQHWKDYLDFWNDGGFRFIGFSGEGDHDITARPVRILQLVVPKFNIDSKVGVMKELQQADYNGIWMRIGMFVGNLQTMAHEHQEPDEDYNNLIGDEAVIYALFDYDDFATESWIIALNDCGLDTCTIWEDKDYTGIPVTKMVVE